MLLDYFIIFKKVFDSLVLVLTNGNLCQIMKSINLNTWIQNISKSEIVIEKLQYHIQEFIVHLLTFIPGANSLAVECYRESLA